MSMGAGKIWLVVKRLRADPNAILWLHNKAERAKYPEDIRDRCLTADEMVEQGIMRIEENKSYVDMPKEFTVTLSKNMRAKIIWRDKRNENNQGS